MKKQPPRALADCVQAKLESPASNKKLISDPEVNILLFAKALGHLRGKFACNVCI